MGAAPDRRLIISLALNLLITLLQVAGGIVANSLGLLSDAAHNLSDVVALGLSLWAVRLGRRQRTPTRTYAYKRAEILVALFNSAVLVGISVYIVIEAIRRIANPEPVEGLWVIAFAAGGLVINTFAALLLRSHGHDLNLRAAFLHLVGDAATSFGVMLSGIVIYYTDWSYADPIVSILVSVWITRQAVRIIRATVNVLMEGTPEGVEFAEVDSAIRATDGVEGVHDLHIWSISSADLALSAHIEARRGDAVRIGGASRWDQADAGAGFRYRPRDPGVGTDRRRVRREHVRSRAQGPQPARRRTRGAPPLTEAPVAAALELPLRCRPSLRSSAVRPPRRW